MFKSREPAPGFSVKRPLRIFAKTLLCLGVVAMGYKGYSDMDRFFDNLTTNVEYRGPAAFYDREWEHKNLTPIYPSWLSERSSYDKKLFTELGR